MMQAVADESKIQDELCAAQGVTDAITLCDGAHKLFDVWLNPIWR